ncbi:MAG: carbamoyl-phosphate synthase large subunit [Provencibacterium sp.]|jgi:carbamoyl-phosphate synthase large subunit|nr:carbamoyl-phosphate synthase large subunit [Provencibacterium sp.]
MPLDSTIQRVLLIGSGPIVIGQAAEFDYAGTQACRALKEEGLEVVLVNPNPATIMTDREMADAIYLEPLTVKTLTRILERERPDALLSTLGGQSGLTLSMQLEKEGVLRRLGVRLLGASPEAIDKAEDRRLFKEAMEHIGQPVVPSAVVTDAAGALQFAAETGYPVIVRPAFTLGGSGGGIAEDEEALIRIAETGLRLSPIHQILVEKSIAGWKEIEFEVVRDRLGNAVTVCSMENFDPVGVHTGDSIVVAPTLTLSDREYQMLRSAALAIIEEMRVEGGCNCQFALSPDSFQYAVIEVNPRVSRSSALASKATGYPIAKVAAKIAVGYTLDEIQNAITGKTFACFEPALDYVVVKLPKWPFDKFVYARRTLGTQMKATGEVMAIGRSFESALMKAVRGAELGLFTLRDPALKGKTDEEIRAAFAVCDDRRLFALFEALLRGIPVEEVHAVTKIDRWFLFKLKRLAELERRLMEEDGEELIEEAKRCGYPAETLEQLTGKPLKRPLPLSYRMVDTCAGEFAAETPYFYSVYGETDEAGALLEKRSDDRKTVVVLGSGPIRIGQGIEFDYASVQCVRALRARGYETVIINNNPETVSTDFDTADRLYFEPLTAGDVAGVLHVEKPLAVVAAFGGGTAIKLTRRLTELGYNILGTSAESIDRAEDRERFDALLEKLSIPRPKGESVHTLKEAIEAANRLQYPVLLRPSYVLGGQNMIIAHSDDDVREYMSIILSQGIKSPVLIDQYLAGTELEVDAVCDGEDILIPGIMEHVERAGVHSGDSIAVYPAGHLGGEQTDTLIDYTRRLALAIGGRGLFNVQYVAHRGKIYVIEVNPRSSRTVPYLSKVSGVPMVELAVRAMLGERLCEMGYGTGLYRDPPYIAVKVPVFSFEKLQDLDTQLGPEMKSTGEVLGIGKTMAEALYKGMIAAGYRMSRSGGVLLTVRDSDKADIVPVARGFDGLGFTLYATAGTARILERAGLRVRVTGKIHQSQDNPLSLLESGQIQYIISTSAKGRLPERDSVRIRRGAVERGIPCLTAIDTARALLDSLYSRFTQQNTELVDINHMRRERMKLRFIKMEGCGNDYIYFDCFSQRVEAPESLAVSLSDRHFGVGGDGVVLIEPSAQADARMRMFNRDGSEGRMCGNAIRCVAKYLYESGLTDKQALTIDTASGPRQVRVFPQNGIVASACVDMGKAELVPEKIPVVIEGSGPVIARPVILAGQQRRITCVSMGNPHCVLFCEQPDALELEAVGPAIENDPLFPERVNVEFVQLAGPGQLRMRVWERGSEETLACGTGACAAAVAAVLCGHCGYGEDIRVHLLGGELTVRYEREGRVYLSGECRRVFTGEVEV